MGTIVDWFTKPFAHEPASFAEWAHAVAVISIGFLVLLAAGCGS